MAEGERERASEDDSKDVKKEDDGGKKERRNKNEVQVGESETRGEPGSQILLLF